MKGHLKRNFTPASWFIERKANTFIMKPMPGTHAMKFGLPLAVVLKDLKQARTTRDAARILQAHEVMVDGKMRDELKFMVGLMDVLSLPKIHKYFRMLLDEKGRLTIKEISAEESKIKINKIMGKTPVKDGQLQFNLYDGRNILTKEKGKVGDSVVLGLPEGKIQQVLELKKGAHIYLLEGKYAGGYGVLQEITGDKIIYQKGEEKFETLKKYALVIGENKPLIKVEHE